MIAISAAYPPDGAWVLLVALAASLVVTMILEVATAAFFAVGWRGLGAVALVNVVTNPVFNVILLGLWGLTVGLGYAYMGSSVPFDWIWLCLVPVLEVAVVIVEWRLLRWALSASAEYSRRLLALSVTMNLVSAVAGTLLVLWLFPLDRSFA